MATLTAEETELYDRQIRAWGFEAQKRMRESKVLVVGLDGAGSENLKNLVLAGLGNITILENKTVTNALIETHFYVQSVHLKQNFAEVALHYFRDMNPNIKLSICTDDPYTKTDDFYRLFDVVILNNHSRYLQLRINHICNENNIGFFSARSIGSFGYIFADLQSHQYQINIKKKSNDTDHKEDNVDTKRIESLNWYSLESALCISNEAMYKQLRGKAKKYRSWFYALQIAEKTEDKILEMNDYFKDKDMNKSRDLRMIEMMNHIRDEKASASYNKVFKDVVGKVKQSRQFKEDDMKNDKILDDLLRFWNLSVCPSNAMLGGYLANFVMFYVQRKRKPLHNFLFFDLWCCQAIEVLMRNEENEQKEIRKSSNKMDVDEITEMDDKKNNNVVLLDDSDDEDIDLAK